ncbi:MAG: acyltransferase [Flavobacteriia bacterium]|nr:acyltransferase [Flavobacteriia bacterium]
MTTSALLQNQKLKSLLHQLMVPKNQARPRKWVSWFVNPVVHSKGKGAKICRRVRMDVLPHRKFHIGANSTIEDFSVINNGVGDVHIGDRTRIGIGNTVIGPAIIEDDVIFAQHVTLSGLNHEYRDVHTPIHQQPINTAPIHIKSGAWIAANSVITAGVTIGKNSVVAAGSVVTKDVPDYSIAAGNPAKVIKKYNFETEEWERV